MKWTIWHTASLVVVGLAFAGVTVMKHGPKTSTNRTGAGKDSTTTIDNRESFWRLYRRATRARTAGRIDSAAALYRSALRRRPEHQNSLYYLGHIQWEQGRLPAADSTWRRLVTVNPESARGHTQIGEAHFCVRDHSLFNLSRARTAYQRALELHNEETLPLLRLGTIALLQHRSQADEHLEALANANANNAVAPFLRGYLAWKNRRSARATVLFRKAQSRLESEDRSGACPLASRLTAPLRKSDQDRTVSPSAAYARLDSLLQVL